MYSVDELLIQIDQESDNDDDLENVIEQDNSNENEIEADEAEEVSEKKDDESESTKKVKKPRKTGSRPKLDAERLKGPRGLACMEKMFSKIEFQGRGHEREDLNAVMNTMQYWCHRLFPKYNFDDCLAHLERLGNKKPVMTLKKKILYGMLEEDQLVTTNEVDELNEEQQEAINEFDRLLEEEPISSLSQPIYKPPDPPKRIELTDEQKKMIERNRLLAAEKRKARLEALQQKQAEKDTADSDSHLTEEQKSIIERNRLLAIEKLRGKQNLDTSITSSMVPSSQNSETNLDITKDTQNTEEMDINELLEDINSTIKANENKDTSNQDNEAENAASKDVDINDFLAEINSDKTVDSNNLQEVQIQCSAEINSSENSTTEKMDMEIVISESNDKNDNELNKNEDVAMEISEMDVNSTNEDNTPDLLEQTTDM